MKFTAIVALIAGVSAIKLDRDFYFARDNGRNLYERVPTTRFSGDHDDLFMRSMIMNYAREGKNEDGSPNGVFTMTEAQTRGASAEVLSTHKKMSGAETKEYLQTYFPRTWAHFDVNKVGFVGVEVLPQFVRFLASDQQLSL